MRQLLIEVARGCGSSVLDAAQTHDGVNLSCLQARNRDDETDLAIAHLPNAKVEAFLQDVQDRFPDARITLEPRGVITLKPPASRAPEQVTQVQPRSPVEVFLGSLQSVGSWGGFLGYAVAAGVVVWIGLYTETVYLLVAAMLLAPFAGPAMVLAAATARGDAHLIGRSLLRYFGSVGAAIAVAWILSIVFRQQATTRLMVTTSLVSSMALLLPLTAGAAGALNQCLSERNSLVSGAATGVLVAASLAPPAGIIGMGAAVGDWDIVKSSLFVLLLQLVGINFAGAVVFRAYGLSPQGARYDRGRGRVAWGVWGATGLALAALLAWQFSGRPDLQRSTREQRARVEVQRAVDDSRLAHLVDAEVRFSGSDIAGQDSLLGVVYVQRQAGVDMPEAELRQTLTRAIQAQLLRQDFRAVPLVDISVLNRPPETPGTRRPR